MLHLLYSIQNSQVACKKCVAPIKASVKNMKSTVIIKKMAKILIATVQVNLYCLLLTQIHLIRIVIAQAFWWSQHTYWA